jgi:hypothetical protein
MKTDIKKDDLLFGITIEDVQYEALRKIGRKLTKEELEIAKKGLESGLRTGISSIYKTIFKVIEENSEP